MRCSYVLTGLRPGRAGPRVIRTRWHRGATLLMGAAVALGATVSSAAGTAYARARTAASAPVVRLRSIPGLGRVLVDGSGRTLYAYVPDHRGRSRCYGFCAIDWPPLLLRTGTGCPRAGTGVRRSLLGTTRRRNGALQVTYDHWPLYRYVTDAHAGQAAGQGDDMGLWFVVGPGGALNRRPLPE